MLSRGSLQTFVVLRRLGLPTAAIGHIPGNILSMTVSLALFDVGCEDGLDLFVEETSDLSFCTVFPLFR